jgi:hypothetical protein
MKTASTILAAAVVAAGATSLSVPANAAPITLPSSLQNAAAAPVETVQWRRWGGWRAWGPGLAAGAIVGGAIAASRYGYYDDYAYSPYGAYAYSPYGTGPSGYNSYNYNYAPGYSYNYVPGYTYSYGPSGYSGYAYSPGTSYAVSPGSSYAAAPGSSYAAGDAVAYCKQRFRSYDPSSGTYLGYDGQRHPCP